MQIQAINNNTTKFKAQRVNFMPSDVIHQRAVALMNIKTGTEQKSNLFSKLFPSLCKRFQDFKNKRILEQDTKLVASYSRDIEPKPKIAQDVQKVWNEFLNTKLP